MKLLDYLSALKKLKNIPFKRTLGGVSASAALMLSIFSTHHEGYRTSAYLDSGRLASICEGHTPGVYLGMTATPEECRKFKETDEAKAFAYVNRYVTVPLYDYERASYASFVNNLGAGRFRDSTMLKHINAQRYYEACEEFSRWVYVGPLDCRKKENQKICGGLPVRREEERKLCHGELPWYFFNGKRPWWVF